MELVVRTKRGEESLLEGNNKYMKGVRHLCESGVLTRVPAKYILPVSDRPSARGQARRASDLNLRLPVIDLEQLRTPHRAHVLDSLAGACEEHGFFQVVNHGIPTDVIGSMIDVSKRFFELSFEERVVYMSPDISAPVRYGTSFNQSKDGVFCWRDFLKLSCHPLSRVLPHWPSSPVDLRQVATSYAKETRNLFLVLMGAILESLGLEEENNKNKKNHNIHIMEEFEEATQMMVMNCFPACPEPDLTLGMPPHSDYGFLTFVLQDEVEGLQIQCNGDWVTIQPVPDSLVVNVGDHLEVDRCMPYIFSNGRYRSVLHRVLVNSSKSRISVASLHSLPFESVVSPAPQLVNDENPRLYMDTDFAAFLDHLSSNDSKHKNFLESRKLTSERTKP